MKELTGPYYVYTDGRNTGDKQIVPTRSSVFVRAIPSQELRTSTPTQYWRQSYVQRPSRKAVHTNDAPNQVVRRSLFVRGTVPLSNPKQVYVEMLTRKRTRYRSDGPCLENGAVGRIYDVHNPSSGVGVTTTTHRNEYVPIQYRRRSTSAPRLNDVFIRANRVQAVPNFSQWKPGGINSFIGSSGYPVTLSTPVTKDYNPETVKPHQVVKSQPIADRQSRLINIYHLDKPVNARGQTRPDFRMDRRTNNPLTIMETPSSMNGIAATRSFMSNSIPSIVYLTRRRSVSALSPAASSRPVVPYPATYTWETKIRTSQTEPYTSRPASDPSASVPARMNSDASTVSTWKNVYAIPRPASPSNQVFNSAHDVTYIIGSSNPADSEELPKATIFPPNVPTITVWSENGSRQPYDDGEKSSLVNGTKQSKINQMGPPMLFSDLESDSDTSEMISRIYQVVTPEPLVKTTHKNLQNSPKLTRKESSMNLRQTLVDIHSKGAVTLINPNAPNGPKVTDEGPVYLYATRQQHETLKSHHSD